MKQRGKKEKRIKRNGNNLRDLKIMLNAQTIES